jgi:hypothetical protein
MKISMHTLKAVLLIGTIASASPPALAQEQRIEVEGMAAVINGDIGHARDRALDDAKRKAVEQVAGAQVSSESISQNFQLVEERIYSRASGFVKKYEIKSEFKDGDTYVVKIAATVDARAIADDMSQLFAVKPRVIVMIAEQNVGGAGFSYWWGSKGFSSEMDLMQTALIGQWQPKGFKFVDPGMLRGRLKVTKAMQRADLDTDDALELSKSADADVAIVGKVVVTDAGPVMQGVNMRSFHAVGNLRVLNVDTGEIIAVSDESAVAAHIDGNQGGRLAIKALAEKLGGNLQKEILKKWTAEAASSQTLEVVVRGITKPAQLRDLTALMTTEIRGIERVDVRKKSKDTAYLDVKIRGSSRDLAAQLEAKTLGDVGIDVEEMSKAKLTLVLGAKP